MTTRIGRISIRVPQMRGGGLDTEELKLLPRFEQAFLLTLLEMVIDGVSTRKVRRVMEELWGLEGSQGTALRLFGLLAGRVAEWNERPLEGNLLDKVHKNDRQQVHAMLKYMFDAATKEKASVKQPVNMAQPEAVAVNV